MEATVEARKLIVPRFKNAEYERTIYQACVEAGVAFEEVQNPAFWGHVGEKLRPNDRIEVIAEDGAYFAELLVISCDRLWAKTAVLRFVELSAPDVSAELLSPLAAGYKVDYKGPHKKHVVIRLSDNEIVKDGIATKAEANGWVSEHVKTLAR
jgi:hypothetical protein